MTGNMSALVSTPGPTAAYCARSQAAASRQPVGSLLTSLLLDCIKAHAAAHGHRHACWHGQLPTRPGRTYRTAHAPPSQPPARAATPPGAPRRAPPPRTPPAGLAQCPVQQPADGHARGLAPCVPAVYVCAPAPGYCTQTPPLRMPISRLPKPPHVSKPKLVTLPAASPAAAQLQRSRNPPLPHSSTACLKHTRTCLRNLGSTAMLLM